jgi:hypothetical protein
VIVTTDHGHIGPHSLFDIGHGFQSPNETSTFVIADIAGDTCDGCMNNSYSIVDITPTVLSLFGIMPPPYFEGVPLGELAANTVKPANLYAALNQAIDMYGWPDPATTIRLSLRTIATIVPFLVYDSKHSISVQFQQIVDQGFPLVSPLAGLALVPVTLVFDGLYVVTNVPAQMIAKATGVTGASTFPLLPPDWPTFPPAEPIPSQSPAIVA